MPTDAHGSRAGCCNSGFSNSRPVPKSSHSLWASQLGAAGSAAVNGTGSKSAMGNCCLYWSVSGSLDMARWMIIDSHQSEPDPVNAIEKAFIVQQCLVLGYTLESLKDKGFEIRADAELVEALGVETGW